MQMRSLASCTIVLSFSRVAAATTTRTATPNTLIDIQNILPKPFIIAHRGGSALFPGSSIGAYRDTLENEAADFLECDMAVTKDNVLLCEHEPDLSKSTNVGDAAFKRYFAEKDRSEEQLDPIMDFDEIFDEYYSFVPSDCTSRHTWYTPDYPWIGAIEKLSAICVSNSLKCNQTVAAVNSSLTSASRDVPLRDSLRLATLHELWDELERHADKRQQAIMSGSKSIPRRVGLYLEIKHATWHQSRRQIDSVATFLSFLNQHSTVEGGLRFTIKFPLFLQSFEVLDLIRLRLHLGFDNPNIKLVGLASSLRTIFNLPPECCTESTESHNSLSDLETGYSVPEGSRSVSHPQNFCIDGGYDQHSNRARPRNEGHFGQMFLGVARKSKSADRSLALQSDCREQFDTQESQSLSIQHSGSQSDFMRKEKVDANGQGETPFIERAATPKCSSHRCLDFNVGLKIVTLGLNMSSVESERSQIEDTTPLIDVGFAREIEEHAEGHDGSGSVQTIRRNFTDKRKEACLSQLEKIRDSIYQTCNTTYLFPTYVLDSPASTTNLFDVSCYLDVLGIHLDFLRRHPELVKDAQSRMMAVHAWTVKTIEDLKMVAMLGLDGVITDDAKFAKEWFDSRL